MSRPALSDINRSVTGWVSAFNSNFEKLIDGPFPIGSYASTGDFPNAKLYKDCIAETGGVLYKSDGSTWKVFRERLSYLADLDGGTATVSDIRTALNTVLSGLKSKGWME